jgi:hypothetical protein
MHSCRQNNEVRLSALELACTWLTATLYYKLQCGHDFSVMEIMPQGQVEIRHGMLQCGHDFSVMEIRQVERTHQVGINASMWP